MKAIIKMMTVGAIVLGLQNVQAQAGKYNQGGQHAFVNHLDKELKLSEKQEKQILQIKQKEAEKIAKYQNKIDQIKLDTKNEIEKKLTNQQKEIWQNSNKRHSQAHFHKGENKPKSFYPQFQKPFPPKAHQGLPSKK